MGKGDHHYEVASLKDLDQLPELIHVVEPSPSHPELIGKEDVYILFKFFINAEGNVRIPTAELKDGKSVDGQILDAVHHALIQRKFTPPILDGKPVVTRAAQPFRFSVPEVVTESSGQD